MKKTIVTFLFCWVALSLSGHAAIILLDNTGDPGTGDNLDGISTTPVTNDVPEISGLQIIITGILGTDTGAELNSTSTSLGINSDNDTDTDQFEAALEQGFTFQFTKDVSISQLDFVTFDSGETVSFDGFTIGYDDLTNKTTDIYEFSSPLEISADTDITLQATAGIIGIEAITLTVVPEPATLSMIGLGGMLALLVRRTRRWLRT